MSIITKIFGDPNQRVINKMMPGVQEINALEQGIKKLSDSEIKSRSLELRGRAQKAEDLDILLPEAFALAREAARRTLGQRHFDVQLLGGIVLHRGQIAEMRTGEGKTLTATCPIYLNALTGHGVHVVTVNDYLAKRDAVWMGQIYNFLGLTVASIQHESAFIYDPSFKGADQADKERDALGSFKVAADYLRPVSRREAYAADIVYGTNNEFGFDYLRDNMVPRAEEAVQRELNFAIVDEVDSILIDEARTPLIISAPAEESGMLYAQFAKIVVKLRENEDYNIDEKMRAVTLTEEGIKKVETDLGMDNIYTEGGISMVHHVEQALRAHALFKRDRDYVVKEGEIIIVDEFTGRLMFGRRYSEGLHQAIEAKEGVEVQRESMTLATVTFQNYFRLYKKLSGMTGTAVTEAEEFAKIYNLEVTLVPTNKPMLRNDMSDRIYKNEIAKFTAVIKEIKERHHAGQPVLVGTISIEKNELLGEMLSREGIPFNLLNAKNHEKEAEIIAQAGRPGAVTIATNMAGRGVDIILGGNPAAPEDAERVKAAGGLLVLGTERHESRRIDNQLRGRSGRQGDPGASQFYVSMEDDLMRIFAGDRMKSLMETLRVPDDVPIENRMVSKSIESAQRRVEGNNFDIRKHLLEYDDVLNKHREVIYRKRREILQLDLEMRQGSAPADALKTKMFEYIESEIEQVVLFHTAGEDMRDWNIEEIYEVCSTIFPVPADLRRKLEDFELEVHGKADLPAAREKIIAYIMDLARAEFEKTAGKINNPETVRNVIKGVIIRSMDSLWVEHLEAVDHLRAGIGLRGYGQRDPLVEYKHETFKMFNELLTMIQKQIVYTIFKVSESMQLAPSIMQRAGARLVGPSKSSAAGSPAALRASAEEKVGRNDPCPCGSGKKYKKCHGK
ncbi:MAG: preprotein translocase subunit SecA [Patescibacteria group bacterium]|nr:preprotein translocase subunit SecA [Patescibacteria group bacterium]